MLFSVIIPIYNAEKTLRRCLNSLASQSESMAELILVNDGSTDNSDEICKEYCELYSNIKYIVQKNRGVSSARNAGIEQASGDFITFVDSDDYVAENYFDVLKNLQDVDLLTFAGVNHDDGSLIETVSDAENKKNKQMDSADFLSEFLQTRNGSPWNKRFRRSIVQEKGIVFPQDLSIGEDFVFCLRYITEIRNACAIRDRLYIVDESNPDSLTRRYNPAFSSQTLLIYQYSFTIVRQSTFDSSHKTEYLKTLDYNYFRTSFACVKELRRSELNYKERISEAKDILARFAEEDRHIPPRNLMHRLSKTVVKKKLAHVAYYIACIHDRYFR